MNIPVHIARNIQFLRKELGQTQDRFAKELGIKKSRLGSYEEGRCRPPYEAVKLLCYHFGVSMDDLLFTNLSRRTEDSYKSEGIELDVLEHRDHYETHIVLNGQARVYRVTPKPSLEIFREKFSHALADQLDIQIRET